MTDLDPVDIIDELLPDLGFCLTNEDYTIVGLISCSGSIGWGFDTYNDLNACFIKPDKIAFSANIYLSGTPDEDTSILGTSILARVQGEAIKESEHWEVSEYEVLEADFYPLDDYDEYYSSIILSNSDFYSTFLKSLAKIEVLLYAEVIPTNLSQTFHQSNSLDDKNIADVQQHLFGLLHVNVISALETFLSDAFINTVAEERVLIRRFVESNPDFAKQKFSLNELFTKVDNIDKEIKKYLSLQIWHNLKKVKQMYKSTLKIEFTEDLTNIFKAIDIRHDLVHRNGKSKNGEARTITQEDIKALMEETRKFAEYIDCSITKLKLDTNDFDF